MTAQSRLAFYQRLLAFSEQKGITTITNHPTVSKQPVDLHDLYKAVQERGGFELVRKRSLPDRGTTKSCVGSRELESDSGNLENLYFVNFRKTFV